MPRFIDTTGLSRIAIGICARCSRKFPMVDLWSDPNSPGLLVCQEDLDQFDPYRLPARETEPLVYGPLRPDVSLSPGPTNMPVDYLQAGYYGGPTVAGDKSVFIALDAPANPEQQPQVWQPGTAYAVGAQVVPANPVGPTAAGKQIMVFLCEIHGKSGTVPPTWNTNEGAYTLDGTVVWITHGLYLP